MKQLKLLFPVLILLCLSSLLTSCCSTDERITSENGFYFRFSEGARITKVELVGAGKIIDSDGSDFGSSLITLNPADTVSSYRIFYETLLSPDTSGSGIVTLGYSQRPSYKGEGCGEELVIVYNAHVSGTTFSKVVIHQSTGTIFNAYPYVEISR